MSGIFSLRQAGDERLDTCYALREFGAQARVVGLERIETRMQGAILIAQGLIFAEEARGTFFELADFLVHDGDGRPVAESRSRLYPSECARLTGQVMPVMHVPFDETQTESDVVQRNNMPKGGGPPVRCARASGAPDGNRREE
jgi:hypothetical protein